MSTMDRIAAYKIELKEAKAEIDLLRKTLELRTDELNHTIGSARAEAFERERYISNLRDVVSKIAITLGVANVNAVNAVEACVFSLKSCREQAVKLKELTNEACDIADNRVCNDDECDCQRISDIRKEAEVIP